MPVRIYALAKELDIDSKVLVEACDKVGITGKGSALASLDDDEVSKVKSFLEGPKEAPKKPAVAEPERPMRPSAPVDNEIKVIPPKATKRKKSDTTDTPETAEEPVAEAEEPASEAAAEAAPEDVVEPTPAAAEASESEEVAESQESSEGDEPATEEPKKGPLSVGKSKSTSGSKSESKSKATSGSQSASPSKSKDKTDDAPEPAPPEKPPSTAPTADEGAPLRNDPLMPRKIEQLPTAGAKDPKAKPKAKRDKKRRAPVIKLPKLANVEEPSAKKEKPKSEPSVKPTISLTPDSYKQQSDLKKLEAQQTAGPIEAVPAETETGRRGRKKGKGKGREEGGDLAGMSRQRASRRSSRRRRSDFDDDSRSNYRTLRHTGRNTAAPRKGNVVVELPCSVRSLSEGTGVSSGNVLKTLLLQLGVQANINSLLDDETAELVATAMDLDVEFRRPETAEDQLLAAYQEPDNEEDLVPRPPIVTFLGHVDHGKTSLLDYLIGSDVVSGEAGGITQHIRAYQVETPSGGLVSFVDTPGHAAFTEMRARGANVTDIVVLVVASDDGIMPQTEEAISHAKAAGVPIVVACNKIDLPGADSNKVMTQLTEYELTPSEWGGEIEVVKTSAITGDGMDDLLETLLTIAELHEFKANPDRKASGTCIEAQQETGQGVVAKLVVRNGTLRVGDDLVCGSTHGRVKAIFDTLNANNRIEEAGPSMPVNITGFDTAPGAGETFYVVDDISTARDIAEKRADESRDSRLGGISTKVSFADFQSMLSEGRLGQENEVTELNLIIRADVRGSNEAILKELDKFEHPEVHVRVLQNSVGGITASDVQLANASHAVVVGFNVIPDEAARSLADELGVEIRRYDIIYKLTDDIKAMVEGKLKPEERIIELGRALVKEVYTISRVGTVAGCYVISGSIERNCRIRVNREGRTIGDYPLDSLRRIKDDVKEVPRGMECGMRLQNFNDIKRDDLLEAYKIEEVARTL